MPEEDHVVEPERTDRWEKLNAAMQTSSKASSEVSQIPPGSFMGGSFAASSFAAPLDAEWRPDTKACECCGVGFGLLTRRHHCRRCGRCVCGKCSPFKMHLEKRLTRPSLEAAVQHTRQPAAGSEDAQADEVTERAYVLDNSRLQSVTRGVGWRRTASLSDIDDQAVGPGWGAIVHGTPFAGEWLKVGDRYLPMKMNDVQILVLVPDPSPNLAGADGRAHRVCKTCHLGAVGVGTGSLVLTPAP